MLFLKLRNLLATLIQYNYLVYVALPHLDPPYKAYNVLLSLNKAYCPDVSCVANDRFLVKLNMLFHA